VIVLHSVYVVINESYDYWNDYECSIEVFSIKEDALDYFRLLRDNTARIAAIDNDIIDSNNDNISAEEVIRELILQEEQNLGVFVTNDKECFVVDIEEWGYNKIYIKKKEIMKCNIN
jgi:hypothetical protein